MRRHSILCPACRVDLVEFRLRENIRLRNLDNLMLLGPRPYALQVAVPRLSKIEHIYRSPSDSEKILVIGFSRKEKTERSLILISTCDVIPLMISIFLPVVVRDPFAIFRRAI